MTPSGRVWNDDSFWEDAESKLDKNQLQVLRDLYGFAKKNAEVTWGTGSVSGSFNPKHIKISPRSFFTFFSNGAMSINFGYLNDDDQRNQLLRIIKKSSLSPSVIITKDLAHSYPTLKADIVLKYKDEIIKIWEEFIS